MNAKELFDAMGVVQQTESWVYEFVVDGVVSKIEIFDAETSKAPTPETKRFAAMDARSPDVNPDEFFDIAIETADPRDIMAFCYACENDQRMGATGETPAEERMFSWQETAIINPFADEQYGLFIGEHRTNWTHNEDGRAVLVTDPAQRSWAAEYLEWRNAFASRLLAPTETATP